MTPLLRFVLLYPSSIFLFGERPSSKRRLAQLLHGQQEVGTHPVLDLDCWGEALTKIVVVVLSLASLEARDVLLEFLDKLITPIEAWI